MREAACVSLLSFFFFSFILLLFSRRTQEYESSTLLKMIASEAIRLGSGSRGEKRIVRSFSSFFLFSRLYYILL